MPVTSGCQSTAALASSRDSSNASMTSSAEKCFDPTAALPCAFCKLTLTVTNLLPVLRCRRPAAADNYAILPAISMTYMYAPSWLSPTICRPLWTFKAFVSSFRGPLMIASDWPAI